MQYFDNLKVSVKSPGIKFRVIIKSIQDKSDR